MSVSERGLRLRQRLVCWGFVAVAAGLGWRALDLHLSHQAFLRDQAQARHLRTVEIAAHRGRVLDRNGEVLAVSTPVESVWVNPSELDPDPRGRARLAEVLGLEPGRIAQLLDGRAEREFVYVRRHIEPELAARVRELELAGVYLQSEYRRYYPLGEVAAHVVGFADIDHRGREGLEFALEESLRGIPGSKRVIRDRLGRAVDDVELIRAPHPGGDVTISIDSRLQYVAYRALLAGVTHHRARGGSVVVLDVRTGEVLAMVNQPSYNPNNRTERVSARMRNRAITDLFEPGSTIKPFTIAAGLETGLFVPTSTIDTRPGRMRVGGHTIVDHRNYGVIDLGTLLKKSSNVGAGKVALAIEARDLWQAFARLGFGQTTASGFPGESNGVLGHFNDWNELERVTLSFGYGLSVTTLQLAQAYAVLATGGLLPRVSFARVDRPEPWVRVMSARSAAEVSRMLESVLDQGGTGSRARVAGYRVAGKTGTTRKVMPGGYSDAHYRALFAGFAPASAPRLAMVVMIDEPSTDHYYGGEVAAPVFAEVMSAALRILGVAPDDETVATRRIALGPALESLLAGDVPARRGIGRGDRIGEAVQ